MVMKLRLYTPAMQGKGSFDGGKITEQKPIGFPGEGSVINRVGPLFYWAWAHTPQEGYIPLHPHYGFEIMTYVMHGTAEHGDSLGTRSTVGPGGVQVIKAGSGVSHEERFHGPDMEGFQIWFEPSLSEENRKSPSYEQYEHTEFPETVLHGGRVKRILGDGSPLRLTADAQMWDVQLEAGSVYTHVVRKGRMLTALAVHGHGQWTGADTVGNAEIFKYKDYMMINTDHDEEIQLETGEEALRIILIEVPERVDYELLPKRF